jgi:hypothetical protein
MADHTAIDDTLPDSSQVQADIFHPIGTSSPHPQSIPVADLVDHLPFTRQTGSQLPLSEHDQPHEFFKACNLWL